MRERLLQPKQIGNLTLPNRVVMTTVKLGYGNLKGEVTERHIAFYVRRAQGGVGLITSEPLYIQPNGRELPTQLGIDRDALIPGLKHLVGAVHDEGGLLMAHINHAGRVANPKLVPAEERVSASDILCPANQVNPRPLTHLEIEAVIKAYGDAARRARQAGFDAIEIPFSHGYLIHQFLSPHSNRRTDEFGGSFQNRFRFGEDIIRAVREQVGLDFPIIVRMNAVDYVEGGLTLEDALETGKALRDMGVNALSVTSGTMCESVPYCLYPTGTPKAHLLPMAAKIRERTGLPIIVAGRIRSPIVARDALAAGQTDLIGLGRPLLADPDWVRKIQEHDEEAILLCAACHQGCLAQLRLGRGSHCMFNPMTGRESEIQITPAKESRRVMVVGGGPAGLEAAAIAARRGHQISLYEQTNRLGGQLLLAAQAPYKEEFKDVIRYLSLMAERAGVSVNLEKKVSQSFAVQMKPDLVIIATGSIPITLPFPGIEKTKWHLASDLLEGEIRINSRTAFVVGGGLVGLEVADLLASQDVQVTVVEMLGEVGSDMDVLAKSMLLRRLRGQGVEIHTDTKVLQFSEDTAYTQQNSHKTNFPIETVVIAVGARPNHELLASLKETGLEIHVIGDAFQPRKALEAIWEGFEIASQL